MRRSSSLLLALFVYAYFSPVAAEHRALFVGNSYSFANNGLLANGYKALLTESEGGEPTVDLVAKGGYTLDGHLMDASQEGQQLHDLLGTDGAVWSVVVLQEQSVIPAYHEAVVWGWFDSLTAAEGLNKLAEKAGAETIFLMTWGRREGLLEDLETLPDYLTMQALLAGGYQKYAEYTSTAERPVHIAPVGLAWLTIWNDAVAAGEEPLDPDGLFWNLYTGDGSHPSALGSYLAALVVFATATGSDPTLTLWRPDSVTTEQADVLRDVAKRVVLGEPTPPPIEFVEQLESDVTPQPADTQTASDLIAAADQPSTETVAPEDLPHITAETTSDLPEVLAPDASTPTGSQGSGCGASPEPAPLAALALVIGLLAMCARRRLG